MNTSRKLLAGTATVALAFNTVLAFEARAAGPNFTTNVIIEGSLCVGFDCAPGIAFGFDTIILKENNLRVFYDDTSVAASFPRNDWRVRVNDSANGGGSYYAIEDATAGRTPFRVDAGARNNALYVDSQGDIGIGTSTPAVDIDIKTGNTPTVRLQQDGSSGFAPQTWDLAGNETSFFIRDATNGSTLPFRIFPSAPSSSLIIEGTTGDVGIGTNSPSGKLHTSGSGTQLVYFESSNEGAVQIRMVTDSTNRRFLARNGADTATMSQIIFGDNEIKLAGATDTGGNLWATINASGIVTQGPTCNPGPCDGVFDPDVYEIESIEQHADYMWKNKHLWAVGPTTPDTPFNVTEKTAGILHELEKAHVYIAQLNDEKKAIQSKVRALESRLNELEAVRTR